MSNVGGETVRICVGSPILAEVERVEPASLQGIELGMEARASLKSAEDAQRAWTGLVDQFQVRGRNAASPDGRPAL